MKKVRIHITMPASLYATIRVIAAESNRSASGQIRHWLKFMVERHEAMRKSIDWWHTSYGDYDAGCWGEEEE